MAQFTFSVCGDCFEQKSRLERHLATSHPPQAHSAADLERASSRIQCPKSKQDLVQYFSQKLSSVGQHLCELIKSLPSRTSRDSADVAVALDELKRKLQQQNNLARKVEELQLHTIYCYKLNIK